MTAIAKLRKWALSLDDNDRVVSIRQETTGKWGINASMSSPVKFEKFSGWQQTPEEAAAIVIESLQQIEETF